MVTLFRITIFHFIFALIFFGISAHAKKDEAEPVINQGKGFVMTQTELQQDVQRFATSFMAATNDAFRPLVSSEDLEMRNQALNQLLGYQSSALDIATGSTPESNLLDMIVFVRLSHEVVRDYWLPSVYGPKAKLLLVAFENAERDVWEVASKIMNESQKKKLIHLINDWRADHPYQMQVSAVRLSEFSKFTGEAAERRARQASGLLASAKQATSVADQGLLLAEKALFLGQRVPFLLRLHGRLATLDLASDIEGQLKMAQGLGDQAKEFQPLVQDIGKLTDKASVLVRETQQLAGLLVSQKKESDKIRLAELENKRLSGGSQEEVEKKPVDLKETLDSVERITEKTTLLVRDLKSIAPGSEHDVLVAAGPSIDKIAQRITAYALAVGFGWAVFFWGGYFLVKRRLPRPV
ncbi:MAG: hypothetical protein ACAH59_08920 [Pseudobdellovibrionaceae bacterium]